MWKVDGPYVKRVSRVVGLLNGKWTIQILCAMRDRPIRMGALRRAIPDASKKALTASLRRLEAEGFVLRRDMSGIVLRVEYELTEELRGPIIALLDHLSEWGNVHWDTDRSSGHRQHIMGKGSVK